MGNGKKHSVRQGECIASLSTRYGVRRDQIWSHGDNSTLRQKRRHPYALLPGDDVVVPDLEERTETGGTATTHKFRLLEEPVLLKLRLLDEDEPRADLPYLLIVDGQMIEGRTNGEGELQQKIPGDAAKALLRLGVRTVGTTMCSSWGISIQ